MQGFVRLVEFQLHIFMYSLQVHACEIVGSLTPITAYMPRDPNRLPPPVLERHFLTEEQLLASIQLTNRQAGYTNDSEQFEFPCNNEPSTESDGLQIGNKALEDP